MTAEFTVPWKTCRFMETGARPAAFNMACDEFLMHKCRREPETAYVRAYRWAPSAFTVGYSQRAAEELDLQACHRDGYDIVRRPTGGRVVLHRDEIAYTVVCANVELPFRRAISRFIGGMFIQVLAALGCRAELVETGAPPRFMKNVPSVCFTHASATEVMSGGRKIMGRSLREKHGIRLEQGFLLLGNGYLDMPEYVRDGGSAAADLKDAISAKTVSLAEATGTDVSQKRALDVFMRTAREYLSGSGEIYELSECDRNGIDTLINGQYGDPGWTERR